MAETLLKDIVRLECILRPDGKLDCQGMIGEVVNGQVKQTIETSDKVTVDTVEIPQAARGYEVLKGVFIQTDKKGPSSMTEVFFNKLTTCKVHRVGEGRLEGEYETILSCGRVVDV